MIHIARQDGDWIAFFHSSLKLEPIGPTNIRSVVAEARTTGKFPASTIIQVGAAISLTAAEITEIVESAGKTQWVNLSGADLSEVDLRPKAVGELHGKYLASSLSQDPAPWYSEQLDAANLSWVRFDDANLIGIRLDKANLVQASLKRALLYGASLEAVDLTMADLRGASLDEASLIDSSLQWVDLRETLFGRADCSGVDFSFSRLEGVNLSHVTDLTRTRWSSAALDRTRLRRVQLGEQLLAEQEAHLESSPIGYSEASEIYQLHKINFTSIGRHADASWAYVKERQLEKMAYYRAWWTPWRLKESRLSRLIRRVGRALRHSSEDTATASPSITRDEYFPPGWQERGSWSFMLRWLESWFHEALTGYGERPLYPIIWALFFAIVFFPLLYWATGALPDHSRLLASTSSSDIDWEGWGDSVIYSLTTFATLSQSELHAEGTLGRVISAVEASVGLLLFALLVFTFGNRMRRS